MGSLLVVAGIAQIFWQMAVASDRLQDARRRQSAAFGASSWKISSAYPGITMICVGALLLGVASFASN
jgi:hypothetical protein